MDLRFDQGDTGAVNRARNDVVLDVEIDIVALNVEGVAVFGLLDRPVGSAAEITGAGNTRQITLDVDGPYRIRVTDANLDSLLATRIYILNVPTAGLQMELPAHNGRSSPDANDVDPDPGGLQVLASEMNVGGSKEGWHPGVVAAFRKLEETVVLSQVSAGIVSGFEVTASVANPTTKYDVAEGVLETSDFTGPKPRVRRVTLGPFPDIDPLNLATQPFTINGINLAGLVQSNVILTSLQRATIAEIPTVNHAIGAITAIDNTKVLAFHTLKALSDYVRKQGLQNEGNAFTAAAADNLTIQKGPGVTSGLFFHGAATPETPNDKPDDAIGAPLVYLQSIRDGSGGFALTPQTDIAIGFIDDGSGTLQSVASSKYVNYWIYFLNDFAGIVVGQRSYNSREDALAGIGSENPVIPPTIAVVQSQVLRTVITVRANTTGLLTGDAVFSQIQDPITGGASAVLSVQGQTGIVTLEADDIRGTGQWKAPTQVAHGLAVLDVVRVNGSGNYVKALADVLANAGLAIVEEVIDADNFHVAQTGQVRAEGHGLTVGATYYLSDSVAGAISLTPGTVNQPVLVVLDADTVVAQNHRPT